MTPRTMRLLLKKGAIRKPTREPGAAHSAFQTGRSPGARLTRSHGHFGQDDDAGFGHLIHRETQALAPGPRVLGSSVGHLVCPEAGDVIGDDSSDLEVAPRAHQPVDVVRKDARLETVLRVVDLF